MTLSSFRLTVAEDHQQAAEMELRQATIGIVLSCSDEDSQIHPRRLTSIEKIKLTVFLEHENGDQEQS